MSETATSFAYKAQIHNGTPITGTIDAADADDAVCLLETMGLRVVEVEPSERPARPKTVSGDDFLAFNQQLAQLTAAGMPIERGLRLIARDVRSKRLARTISLVAEQMESGKSLAEAFESHRKQFPPMYGQLVDMGVKSGRLPGILLNLGRHVELIRRLRSALWQSAAYPLMVLACMLAVMLFLSTYVLPQFGDIFDDFDVDLPDMTRWTIQMGDAAPYLSLAAAVLVVVCIVAVPIINASRAGRRVFERLILSTPLIGPVVSRNLIARWCDALHLGVDAGLDLPAALEMVGDGIGSPALKRDTQAVKTQLESGRQIGDLVGQSILPATLPAAMQLASDHQDLASTLRSFGQMYQEEAKWRINTLTVLLPPVLVIFVGVFVAFVIVGLFLPLVKLITCLT